MVIPEDILVTILTYLEVVEILRLRRVNTFFRYVTRLRVVWITAYRKSTLILPHLDHTETSEDLERRLVFATLLSRRLSVPSPAPRDQWKIDLLPGEHRVHQMMVEDGTHLVVLCTTGFICADLQTREVWRIPSLQSSAGTGRKRFHAIKVHADSGDGLMIAQITWDEGSCELYFHPFGQHGPPEVPHLIFKGHITVPGPTTFVKLTASKLFVGCREGEALVIELGTLEERQYIVSGPVLEMTIIDQTLLIIHQKNDRSIAGEWKYVTSLIHTLENVPTRPLITARLPIRVGYASAFSSNIPHNHHYPPVISIFALTKASSRVARVNVGRLLHQSDLVDNAQAPFVFEIESPPFEIPINPSISLLTRCRAISFSPTQAVSVVVNDLHTEGRQWLFLNTFEEKQVRHRTLHDADPFPGIDIDVKWDEVSGRLCVFGEHGPRMSPIIVLEF